MNTEDLEIDALRTVASALASLDDAARFRVIKWAIAKFDIRQTLIEPNLPAKLPTPDAPDSGSITSLPQDLPTLFAAAKPETLSDKALTVACWLQTSKNQEAFESQEVNSELKHLGHGIKNITGALEYLISAKPQLVIQTRKSGTTKQARKKYRVTAVGIARVTQLVSGATGNGTQEL